MCTLHISALLYTIFVIVHQLLNVICERRCNVVLKIFLFKYIDSVVCCNGLYRRMGFTFFYSVGRIGYLSLKCFVKENNINFTKRPVRQTDWPLEATYLRTKKCIIQSDILLELLSKNVESKNNNIKYCFRLDMR